MAILRPFMAPTAGDPVPVVAPARQRAQQGNMAVPSFYSNANMFPSKQLQQPQRQAQQPVYQTTQSTVERPQQQQFENTNYTADYVQEAIQKFANRAAPPQLNPGERVKSANAELVQPSQFQGFYDQLSTIGQSAQEQLGTVTAQAAYKRMQALQAIQAKQIAQFGGVVGGTNGQGGMPVGYKNPNAPYYGNPGGEIGTGVFGGRIGSGLNLGGGGSPQANFAIAQQIGKQLGWGPAEINAWYTLGMKESGWRNTAQNPTSSAFGIGQFLDSTWRGVGMSKTSDPRQQIIGMAKYIQQRYGTPSRALQFHLGHNWY